MVKVMIFENFHYPKEMVERIARELKFELVYIPVSPEKDPLPLYQSNIRWAEEAGIDVIISGQYDYASISRIKTSIPLLTLNFSNWETINIVHSLKKNVVEKYFPRPHKVALVTTEPLALDLKILEEIFDLELHNVIRSRTNIPEDFFLNLKDQGFEVVACAKYLDEEVIKAGMLPAFDENIMSYASVREEFAQILQMVKISQQIGQKNRELRQIIDYSFEAIWMTDQEGRITSCNSMAAQMFDLNTDRSSSSEQDYIGVSVFGVLPEEIHPVLTDVLKNGTPYYSHLMLHTKSDGVFNINPVQGGDTVESAIFHFTSLPHLEQMEEKVKIESYVKGHHAKYTFDSIVGESPVIRKSIQLAQRFAKYESGILLLGESGTGKEIFAQSIHNASRRRNQPFVAVNCGALPPSLLESELFGYVDGAFTGASKKGKKGLFEIADQGTIFLDEISEMDAQGQTRLLRVLEEKEIMRIGSDKMIPVNVRVIAACNKNLEDLVREGKFRQDLYYRLNVLSIGIPPLRRRGGDVPLLAEHFLAHYGEKYQKIVHLTSAAKPVLQEDLWPGNVRQLRNFCERLVIVADDNKLSADFVREQLWQSRDFGFEELPADEVSCKAVVQTKEEREKDEVIRALTEAHGSRKEAAAMLGISTATLWRRIKKYGSEDAEPAAASRG